MVGQTRVDTNPEMKIAIAGGGSAGGTAFRLRWPRLESRRTIALLLAASCGHGAAVAPDAGAPPPDAPRGGPACDVAHAQTTIRASLPL